MRLLRQRVETSSRHSFEWLSDMAEGLVARPWTEARRTASGPQNLGERCAQQCLTFVFGAGVIDGPQ